jgi:hypothetical protein
MFVSTLWYLGCRFDKHNSLMTNFIFFEKFSKKQFEKLSYREKMLRFRESSDCFSQKHALNFSNFSKNCSLFPKIRVFRKILEKY